MRRISRRSGGLVVIDALDIPSDWYSQRLQDSRALHLVGPVGDRVIVERHAVAWSVGYRPPDHVEGCFGMDGLAKGEAIERVNAVVRAADREGVEAAKAALKGPP